MSVRVKKLVVGVWCVGLQNRSKDLNMVIGCAVFLDDMHFRVLMRLLFLKKITEAVVSFPRVVEIVLVDSLDF